MKPTIVIIGGGDSFDTYDEYWAYLHSKNVRFFDDTVGWKTTFYRELSDRFTVLIPTMPNRNNATYGEWRMVFEKFALALDPNTVYIGHSLGGIFLAKYFSENPLRAWKIHLIAAPFSPCGSMALNKDLLLLAQSDNVILWYSKDDPVVEFDEMAQYTKAFPDAESRVFEDRRHFNDDRFDELRDEVVEALK